MRANSFLIVGKEDAVSARKQQPLVDYHISGVAVGAIERHLKCFRKFVGRSQRGIYVLRRNGDIYYVGLASSLRSRIAQHLKDHHKRRWDQFDLYVLRKSKAKYVRELESLLIRVAKPAANRTEPKFVSHKNRTQQFQQALYDEVDTLFS